MEGGRWEQQFPEAIGTSWFAGKSFSWLRVGRRVVYKVTDGQRHGGQGEGKEFVKQNSLFPAQPWEEWEQKLMKLISVGHLGRNMARWHRLLHLAYQLTAAIMCCVTNYPKARWLARIIYCSLWGCGSDGVAFLSGCGFMLHVSRSAQ